MPGVFIESYGCSSSQAEAEMMAGLLRESGFDVVGSEKEADAVVIVTCYVKAPTQQKILFRIGELCEKKKLIIAGCMPEGMYNKLIGIAPNASLLSTHRIKEIVQAVEKTLEGKRVEYLGASSEIKLCLPKIRKNPIVDVVPISSGCNSHCYYCCVRLAKGKLFSYPKEMIIKEIESSLKEGCKEVWLTAQDTASYGLDRGSSLPELLRGISGIQGKFLVRVGMMNLKNVLPIASELLEAFRSERMYKFFHLPIQSGSDSVIASMNRGYRASQFEELAKQIRGSFRCQIWTDLIAGYPTENEEDFLETFNFIKRVRPDWANVSKFGARPGTEAAKLKPLPKEVINERSRRLSELVGGISLERNKEWLGWEGEVLVSERGSKQNQWLGRNQAYKHVLIESKEDLLGRFVKVKITKASRAYLTGEPL